MTAHIMLDIESLGTRPGAIILSAALVRFSDEACVQVNLAIEPQRALGMHSDPATEQWWSTQSPEAWAAATCNPIPPADALGFLRDWILWASPTDEPFVWCHGATFDAPLLVELYRLLGASPPWQFWNVRDTRTLYDLAGVNVKDYAVPPPHIALNDAIGQTRAANVALRIIAGNRGLVAT